MQIIKTHYKNLSFESGRYNGGEDEWLARVPLLNRKPGKKEQEKQSKMERIMVIPSLESFALKGEN